MESIYDTGQGESFLRKVGEYEPLLHYAAKRFEIPGVLNWEDLYQEGMIALEETFDYHWTRDPDSEEFTKAFKSRLFHRMHEVLRKYKTQSRDWRKELHATLDMDDEDDIFNKIPQRTFPPPDHNLHVQDLNKYVGELQESLREASRKAVGYSTFFVDAIELLNLITDPNLELPEDITDCYDRVPTEGFSNTILAELTGWDVMHVRRAMKRLRRHARVLSEKYGFSIPAGTREE